MFQSNEFILPALVHRIIQIYRCTLNIFRSSSSSSFSVFCFLIWQPTQWSNKQFNIGRNRRRWSLLTQGSLSRLKVKIRTKNTMPLHVRFHIHFSSIPPLFCHSHRIMHALRMENSKEQFSIVVWNALVSFGCSVFFSHSISFSVDFYVSVLCIVFGYGRSCWLPWYVRMKKPITWRRYSFSFYYYYWLLVRSEGCLSLLSSYGIREAK